MQETLSPIGAELRLLLGNALRVRHISQPLESCKEDEDTAVARSRMEQRGFQLLGVQSGQNIVGSLELSRLLPGTCGEQAAPLQEDQLIDGEASLLDLLRRLTQRHWLFVRRGRKVVGFVSRSDLQRGPVRMLLFGLISLFEMLLHDLVQQHYSEQSIGASLNAKRLSQALRLHAERKKRGEELHLADCLQIADKRDLLLAVEGLSQRLGFESNNAAGRFFGKVEELRDRLVHANDLIGGSSWEEMLSTTLALADFLTRCVAKDG